MAKCKKCGKKLEVNARYCGFCGCKTDLSSPPIEQSNSCENDNTDLNSSSQNEPQHRNDRFKTFTILFYATIAIIAFFWFAHSRHLSRLESESYNAPIETAEGEAITPNTSSSLSGKDYARVVEIFSGRGFTNISVQPVEMTYGFFGKAKHNENAVAAVFVGNDSKYERGQIISSETPVIIEYYVGLYTPFEMEGVALTPGVSSSFAGDDANEAEEVFRSRGFLNIQTELVYSTSKENNQIIKVTVDGDEGYSSTKLVSPETPVIIYKYADPNIAITPPEGFAITPADSDYMSGKDYKAVIQIFRNRGFTNIKTETIADLILGILVSDGEVEDVSVGGNANYVPGQTVPADSIVIIRYHSFDNDNNPGKDGTTSNTEAVDLVGMTVEQALVASTNAGLTVSKWIYQQSSVIQYVQAWDYAKTDYGSSWNEEPKYPKLWIVTAQNNPGKNKIELTIQLNVLNTSNNYDFRTILNQDNAGSENFVRNHKGELIEFTGIIRITEQNSTYNYTYTIYGFDDTRTHVGELFCFSNIDYHAVRLCTDNYSKVDTASYFHIVAEIKGFDNNKGILLKPVGIDYIGPVN